ncbi:hypothetical protein ACEQ8H_004668 [Pleosporales sp. CAS-2024a]
MLANPYAEDVEDDDPIAQYRATQAAFETFFNRKGDVVEQGRTITLALGPLSVRHTYQSKCITHPYGDEHSLEDLMPASVPIRMHALRSLYHEDPNRNRQQTEKKLLINGRSQRILFLSNFDVLLLLAKKLHVVTDNEYMTHLHNLHDRAEYK